MACNLARVCYYILHLCSDKTISTFIRATCCLVIKIAVKILAVFGRFIKTILKIRRVCRHCQFFADAKPALCILLIHIAHLKLVIRTLPNLSVGNTQHASEFMTQTKKTNKKKKRKRKISLSHAHQARLLLNQRDVVSPSSSSQRQPGPSSTMHYGIRPFIVAKKCSTFSFLLNSMHGFSAEIDR